MKTIMILGTVGGRKWRKEFYCYGDKNVNEVCGNCALRFQCLSGREDIKLSAERLGKKGLFAGSVEASDIANFLLPSIKTVIGKDREGHKKVQIDFKKVEICEGMHE